MTTIVNTPAPATDSGGSGFLIGAIVLVTFVVIVLYFGLPFIKDRGPVQLNVPAPQVVMPNKIDVSVTQAK